jgi:DNA-binding CsgD family transcriptional regulator
LQYIAANSFILQGYDHIRSLSDVIRRKTRHQLEDELIEIQHRICQGNTDKEIIEGLNIKERTFYYYKHKLYQMSAAIQAKKREEVMAFETQILKDRFTRLYRHLELKAASPNTKAGEVAKIAKTAQEIAVNILKLEGEGIRVLSRCSMNGIVNKIAQQEEVLQN